LPGDLTIKKLLDENNDPAELAKQITSREGRDYAYASVFALAYCDQELAEDERKLLELLRAEWGIRPEEDEGLRKALDAAQAPTVESGTLPAAVKDGDARTAAFTKLLTRYAVLTALTGAIPVPLVPDLLVVSMQVKMVHDGAALFGHKTVAPPSLAAEPARRPVLPTVQLMFETLGVGTGARLGISALCKLVPVWGSVVGAASSFATTYALGKVAWKFYESQGATSIEALKPLFEKERRQGKEEFKKHQAALEEAQKTHSERLKGLAYDLQQKKITQQEYEKKVDELA
jgi:uncharacterized protein (DUF697 family)